MQQYVFGGAQAPVVRRVCFVNFVNLDRVFLLPILFIPFPMSKLKVLAGGWLVRVWPFCFRLTHGMCQQR